MIFKINSPLACAFRHIPGQDLEVKVMITGLDPTDGYNTHGLHVHAYADLSDGCSSFSGKSLLCNYRVLC